MSGNLLFNVQNHSFLSGLQEFHSFGSEIFTRLHLESIAQICVLPTNPSDSWTHILLDFGACTAL